jgi:FkbM family methyltransferase
MNLDEINRIALQRRNALPRYNTYNIQELGRMPPYWGWVDCEAGVAKFRMFLGGLDDGIALRFLWNGCFKKTSLGKWASYARRGGIIVDIGAHTGSYTLAALAANPAATVAAFEPHFMNFARLNLNLRANGFATDKAFMLALGNRSETLPFSINTGLDFLTTGGSLGARDDASTYFVQTVTLDEFVPDDAKAQVRLVKLCIISNEVDCLLGMKSILEKARPVVFFECTNARTGADIQSVLAGYGYRFYEIAEMEGTVNRVEVVEPRLDAQGNLLEFRKNRIATVEDGVI